MRRSVPLFLLLLCLIGPLSLPAWAASYEDGVKALEAGKPNEALAIWTALAEKGDTSAEYGLGRLYEVGAPGFKIDKTKAAAWYRQAADAGVIAAQNNLALLYAKGEGVPRDLATAAKLWEQAAARGHPTAQYNLGLLHLRGEGVVRDPAQGEFWIHKAAAAGVPAAQFVMGDLRRYGIGVDRDPGLALGWYKRAAEGGYGPARKEAERLEASGVLAKSEAPSEAAVGTAAGAASGAAPGAATLALPAFPTTAEMASAGMTGGERSQGEAAAAAPLPAGKPGAARERDAEPPPSPSPPSPQLSALPEDSAPPSGEALFFRHQAEPSAEKAAPGPAPGPASGPASEPAAAGQATGEPAAEPKPSPEKPADIQLTSNEPAAPGAAEPAAPAPAPGRFGLWLGTASNEKAADRLGRGGAGGPLEALGDQPVTVRRVKVAGLGAVYRVFVGDWAERAEAERTCVGLRAAEPAIFCAAVAY